MQLSARGRVVCTGQCSGNRRIDVDVLSKPAIVPDRREVWCSDGATGFYVLRVSKEVWPTP